MILRSLLLATAVVIAFSCDTRQDLPPDLVAQVEDSYLQKEMLNYAVPEGLSEKEQLSMKKTFIKRWVENEMLYQAAQREGVALDEFEKFQLREYTRALVVEKYLDQKLNKNYKISQKEIEDYYEENSKEFVRSEDEVHLIHLLIEKQDRAIFNEIGESRDLNEIIKKYYFESQSTYESPNGDLGYVRADALPDELARAQQRLKTGAISNAVKSEHGYHFMQVLDRQRAGSQIELELVRDEIVRRLKWRKRNEEFERLTAQLREEFQIQTYLSKVQ